MWVYLSICNRVKFVTFWSLFCMYHILTGFNRLFWEYGKHYHQSKSHSSKCTQQSVTFPSSVIFHFQLGPEGGTVSKVSKLFFLYISIFCTENHAYIFLKSYFFLLYTKESLLHFAFYHLLVYYVQYQNS